MIEYGAAFQKTGSEEIFFIFLIIIIVITVIIIVIVVIIVVIVVITIIVVIVITDHIPGISTGFSAPRIAVVFLRQNRIFSFHLFFRPPRLSGSLRKNPDGW